MALEKIEVVALIEVLENGSVQVRNKTAILEDGVEISNKFHRHVIVPGQDYSQEDSRVKAICAAVQTLEVVAAYQAMMDAVKAEA